MNNMLAFLYIASLFVLGGAAFSLMWKNLIDVKNEQFRKYNAKPHPEAPKEGEEILYIGTREVESSSDFYQSLRERMNEIEEDDGDGDIDSTDTNLTSGDTWAHASKLSYLPNGIVTNQTRVGYGNNDFVDPLASDESPDGPVRPRYIQLDSHQPYQINLNSMWPLDAVAFNMIRRHEPETTIEGFTNPAKYLSFTHGAMGTQIGLTPNAKFGNFDLFHTGTNISLPFKDGTFADWNPGRTPWPTRSAGELVYSTKPTIFFYRQLPTSVTTGSNGDGKHGPIGYNAATASMQYLRHTYPYQSPWWVTNLIVSESLGPMHDTYNDFIGNDLKYIARNYTVVPEFRISENYKFYDDVIKHYRQYSTTKVFELDEEYDETLGTKTFKVKRNFGISYNFYDHKLNFLKIHGADVTASSDLQSMISNGFTTDRWSYDDIKDFRLIDNTKQEKHYQNISGSEYFNKRYVHTDRIKNFTYLMHDKGFGTDVVPSEISFECDAIKKLLPYEGFYPMTRTVQIGSYFKKAFEPHVIDGYSFKNNFVDSDTHAGASNATGSHVLVVDGIAYETISGSGLPGGQTLDSKKQAMMQSLLEPFFAPGLLYNSIKSGIAVDYPVYLQKPPQYYGSAMSASEAINAAIPNDATFNGQQDELLKMTTGSLGHGGYQMMGVANAMPAYLMSRPDYRMPFEALYDLKKMNILAMDSAIEKTPYSNFLVSDFLWGSGSNRITGKRVQGSSETILPHDQGSLDYIPNAHLKKFPSEINTPEIRLYEASINNYLAETMEFFLEPQDVEKNIKFPIISTQRSERIKGAIPGFSYYMDFRLEMGQDHVMCEGPRRSNFIFSSSIPYAEGPLSSSLRGYLYGPPIQTIPTLESTPGSTIGDKGGSGSHHHFNFESAFAANLTDPSYQAWTPPYFYGESRITFKYKPNIRQEEFEDAHKSIITSSFYFEKYNISAGLTPKIPSTSSVSLGSFTRMKIDASIDMFSEPIRFQPVPGLNGAESSVWYAMPKWVCPVLDFSSSVSARHKTLSYDDEGNPNIKLESVHNSYHDETTGRSMWGGYGTDPYDKNMMTFVDSLSDKAVGKSKGIYFSLSETFAENAFETTSAPGYVSDLESPEGYFVERESTVNNILTGSLVHLLFEPNKKDTSLEVGKMASGKNISEAIAIIPYFEQPVELNFTSVQDDNLEGILEEESKDINSKVLRNVFRTRQIIPGKFFLGIHDQTFEKVLSAILIEKFYKSDSSEYENLTKNWRNYDEHNQSTLSNAVNCDVGKMILNLIGQINAPSHRGYQLPPEFDFIHNNKIKPFQIIVIPFQHKLQKQDLIDIYQGVMPEPSFRTEEVFSKINVHPGLQHAIDDPNLISSFTVPASSEGTGVGDNGGKIMLTNFNLANFLSPLPLISDLRFQITDALNESQNVKQYEAKPTGITSSKEFYEKMKFMVFKIKQRGVSNYRRYKERNLATHLETNILKAGNERLNFANFPRSYDIYADEIYGPNWPYDNFSLIETAKIDTKIKVD